MITRRTPPEAVFKGTNATLEQVINIYSAVAGEQVNLTPEEMKLFNEHGADFLREYYELFKEEELQKTLPTIREGVKSDGRI